MKKIVVIGPESTGKSTLCRQLAAHYNCKWVPEFARGYLEKNGPKYSYDDLIAIAKGQIELEEKYIKDAQLSPKLFIDTDMYVMKVWCEYVFGNCYPWIIDRIVERSYDMYLLCNTDLPWTPDQLREYPDPSIRKILFNVYKDILVNQSTPWKIVNGNLNERLTSAVAAIENILK